MGQYYKTRLFNEETKKTVVFNRDVDGKHTLPKLTEHSWWFNPFVNAICERIYEKPHRVAWVGDYADNCEFYEEVWNVDGIGVESTDFLLDGKILINHDRKIYLDCDKYFKANREYDNGKPTNWCYHPLPLLTAIGNGQGRGDYFGTDEDLVGDWYNDLISVEKIPPLNYKECSDYNFQE